MFAWKEDISMQSGIEYWPAYNHQTQKETIPLLGLASGREFWIKGWFISVSVCVTDDTNEVWYNKPITGIHWGLEELCMPELSNWFLWQHVKCALCRRPVHAPFCILWWPLWGQKSPAVPFVKDEWTRFVAKRLLITLLNTVCECQIKTCCDGMQFCLLQKPQGCSDRRYSQPYGRPFPLHWHWRPLLPFSIHRDSLSNSYSMGGTTCTQTPNQARDRALCGMYVILFQGPTFFDVFSQAFLLPYSWQTFW